MKQYLVAAAVISTCGRFRYTLTRAWDMSLPSVVYCMLNPSTADGAEDDPTIRRIVGFAKANGYGSLVVVNLFAFRATEPKALHDAGWPVGPENDTFIAQQCIGRDVVCAWGSNVRKHERRSIGSQFRTDEVLGTLRLTSRLYALSMTKDGIPGHPLYLPANCLMEELEIKERPEQAWLGGRYDLLPLWRREMLYACTV